MTDYFGSQAPESIDRYVLLDAQDWMSDEQITALWQEIDRTAKPGARVIFRTAASDSPLETALPSAILARWHYDQGTSQRLLTHDRSAIYGGFHIYERR